MKRPVRHFYLYGGTSTLQVTVAVASVSPVTISIAAFACAVRPTMPLFFHTSGPHEVMVVSGETRTDSGC